MASSMTVSGLGSGLDINKIVSELIAAERAPATKRLDTKEAGIQSQLSGIGTLKGTLSDFRTAIAGITSAAQFQNLSATTSNDALFSATTTSAAQAGSYDIKVTQLAQAQRLVTSENYRFAAVTDTLGTGTLTFNFGSTTGGVFTENTAKTAKTVTIDASNNTLAGVRDAINKANIGVRANIINDGTGYRLSIGVTDSGAANGLKISVADGDGDPTNQAGLSRLAYDPTLADGVAGKNMTQTIAAQNAALTVDGLAITSASNSVVGVVPGVTLSLKSKSDTAATLTLAQDSTTASKAVEAFVTAYNKLISTSKSLTAYNATTGEKGALIGDSSVRAITGQVRNILTSAVTGAAGSVHSLTEVGISLQRDGTLALDSGKLQTALTTDSQAVASLFSRVGRASDSLVSYSSASSTSKPGAYAVNITQLATQGQYSGSVIAAPDLIIGGVGHDNATFKIKVNGTQSGAITLTQKTYLTGADLAAELQSKINGDSALQAAIASVSVGFSAGQLTFTSNGYGSSSKVQFTEVGADALTTLGFDADPLAVGTTVTNGQDVAGTIGGVAATGSGRKLTGTDTAAGIVVEVLGGSIGARGTVSLSDGIAQRLSTLIGGILSSDGLISNRTDSLNQQVKQITDQRLTLSSRMTDLEARYRTRFLAMDTLVSQLNTTSSFLTQQFSNNSSSN